VSATAASQAVVVILRTSCTLAIFFVGRRRPNSAPIDAFFHKESNDMLSAAIGALLATPFPKPLKDKLTHGGGAQTRALVDQAEAPGPARPRPLASSCLSENVRIIIVHGYGCPGRTSRRVCERWMCTADASFKKCSPADGWPLTQCELNTRMGKWRKAG